MNGEVSVLKMAGRCPLLDAKNLPRSWNPSTIDLSGLEWTTPFDIAGLAALWSRLSAQGRRADGSPPG